MRALDSVGIEVREGEILGLLGPNGSGKSTFINVVCGHYKPDAGVLQFAGRDLARLPAHRIARAGVARTYQIPRPFGAMSVRENLELGSYRAAAKVHRQASLARAQPHIRRAYLGVGGGD